MGRRSKVDIHYSLRASERDAFAHPKTIVTEGLPVKKRSRFIKDKKDTVAFLHEGFVHVFSADLKKAITVIPYSKRKWTIIGQK